MADEIPDISPNMRKVYLRLRRWRSSHARRVPIPEPLWAAAGELAREHGINPTAKALHLEYGKLQTLGGSGGCGEEGGEEGPVSEPAPGAVRRRADIYGTGYAAGQQCGQRGGGTGRAAGPDEDRV